jgi:hypothetical protein
VRIGADGKGRYTMTFRQLTKQDTTTLPIGTMVYCTVYNVQGWYALTAVRPRDGYIRIEGYRPWCPPYNFSLTDTQGKGWSES